MNWLLTTRSGRAAIVAIGVLLCAPSLNIGLVTDDWLHQIEIEHRPIDGMSQRPLDLFTFANGDPASTHRLMDAGMFPWWTHPAVRLAFFRPLTALTHAVDYALWPNSPWLMHAQNLLWFALAILAAGWVYRRFVSLEVAGLALLLFAIDDVHGPAVGWVANRNAMVTVALGFPALGLHQRWRQENWKPGRWLAPLSLLLGLLAGEASLAVVGYLFAFALHVDRSGWRARVLSLVPYGGVLVGWRLVYTALGYGTAHSAVYIDPGHDPLAFLAIVPHRAAALLASQLAAPWSDFEPLYPYLSPQLALIMTLLAIGTVGLLLAAFRPVLRAEPAARMFATGTLLATLPLCATVPADRLLFFVSVGALPLVAQFLLSRPQGIRRVVVWGLVAIHLVLAPPLLALRSRSMETVDRPMERVLRSIPRDASKTVVLVNPPLDPLAGYVLPGLAARHEVLPARLRWLATGTSRLEITREDTRTLRIRSTPGFLANASEQMLRSDDTPLKEGDRVNLTGLEIEVLQSAGGRPTEVRFRFALPLEDPSLAWMRWEHIRFVPWTPPPVGTVVSFEPANAVEAAFAPDDR